MILKNPLVNGTLMVLSEAPEPTQSVGTSVVLLSKGAVPEMNYSNLRSPFVPWADITAPYIMCLMTIQKN